MFGINKNLKLHFIGIGGIGMSGIAKVLMNLGYQVSGSDLSESETVSKLKKNGAEVYIGHDSKNIKDVQIVVYSSAIDESNPEIIEARKQKIPLIKRAEMLAELMRLKYGIAIAGSHGKTTTTSLLATILNKLEFKPTYIIGGLVKNLEDNAQIGDGELLVAEADESDGSFLLLNPIMSVITNIDNDHLDYYENIENLQRAFVEFSNKVPFYGSVSLNAHDEFSIELIKNLKKPHIIYGIEGKKSFSDSIDYKASNIEETIDGAKFDVSFDGEKESFHIKLNGEHNILNALGAVTIAHKIGATLKDISNAITNFEGVSRRQEVIYSKEEFIIMDDYAHHPTEIVATIETVKKKYPNKKIVVCFEPHRYSRTQSFWKEFVESFSGVDEVHISPICAASEEAIEYIDSEVMVKNIGDNNIKAHYIDSLDKMSNIFLENLSLNTIVLILGAGPISRIARRIVDEKLS
jgi:UDP-N-acetylmuramate--alanine ligase